MSKLYLAAAFAAGAASATLVAYYLQKKERKDLLTEIEKMKQECRDIFNDDREEDEDYWAKYPSGYILDKKDRKLNDEFFDQVTEDDIEPEQMEELQDKMNNVRYPLPEKITKKKYREWFQDFEKVTLYYYEDEGMVMDENDALLNEDDVLGPNALEHFMEGNRDPLYIRNVELATDFEVVWRQAFYQDGEEE